MDIVETNLIERSIELIEMVNNNKIAQLICMWETLTDSEKLLLISVSKGTQFEYFSCLSDTEKQSIIEIYVKGCI